MKLAADAAPDASDSFEFVGGGGVRVGGSSSLFSLRQKLLKHYFCHFSLIVFPLLHNVVVTTIDKNTLFCLWDLKMLTEWPGHLF